MLKIFTVVFLSFLCLISMSAIAQEVERAALPAENEDDLRLIFPDKEEIEKNTEEPGIQETSEEKDDNTEESATEASHTNVVESHEMTDLGKIVKIGNQVEINQNQVVSSIISIGGNVKINGRVNQNIFVFVGDVEISSNAEIKKDVTTVIGQIKGDRNQIKGNCREIKNFKNVSAIVDLIKTGYPRTIFWSVVMFIVLLFIHASLTVLLPKNIENMASAISKHIIGSNMLGLLLLAITPLISVLLVWSIVGIPLLFIFYSFLFIMAIYGKTALFVSIGNAFIKKTPPNIISVSLGYIIYRIAILLPYIGKISFVVAITLGIGVSLRTVFGLKGSGRGRMRQNVTLIR